MSTSDANKLIDSIDTGASFEAARDVSYQLVGRLMKNRRAAADPQKAQEFLDEAGAVRQTLLALEPGTKEVDDATNVWGARLRELREQ